MTANQKDFYISCINAAIDFIENNISKDLKLDNIAKAAGLSTFHFHRIFKSFMNENLNDFVRRVRVEKAATMLFANCDYSITKIAYLSGFSSSQALAREFRIFFDTTPKKYRESKIRYKNSKNGNACNINFYYHDDKKRPYFYYNLTGSINMKVEVKKFPDTTLAYIRHIGPYKGNPALFEELFNKLCAWAGSRNLLTKDTNYYCIYHDEPEVTDESKLRMDVCLNVPKDTEVGGNIGKQIIRGGQYAVARCTIKDPKEYEKYWSELYKNWLPSSGYQLDNKPPFEMYPSDCKKENDEMIVDICVPVIPV